MKEAHAEVSAALTSKDANKEVVEIAKIIFKNDLNPERLKERLIILKLDKKYANTIKRIDTITNTVTNKIYTRYFESIKEMQMKQIFETAGGITKQSEITGKLKSLVDYEIILETINKYKNKMTFRKNNILLKELMADNTVFEKNKDLIEVGLKTIEKYKKTLLEEPNALFEVFAHRIKDEPIFESYVKSLTSDNHNIMGIKYLGSDRLKITQSIPPKVKILVKDKAIVLLGDQITEGSIYLEELLNSKGVLEVKQYIIKEIQKIYRLQGVDINDKHIEIIINQMIGFKEIIDNGDTDLILGSLDRYANVLRANIEAFTNGVSPSLVETKVVSIIKSSLETDSFLSSASFQDTSRSLSEASLIGKKDLLIGLKENIIVGKIIPAGTGIVDNYKGIDDFVESKVD